MGKKKKQNPDELIKIKGKEYIEFTTGGKYQYKVIVDRHTWDSYLKDYHWTALPRKKSISAYIVTTYKLEPQKRIHRVIIENEYEELDYWGLAIDHINNNSLDNRLENLYICHQKLNTTNVKSKYEELDNHLIHAQKNGGWKVDTNVGDIKFYKNFHTIEEARYYRDNEIIPQILLMRQEIEKKVRDIEFERGLRDKINANEIKEIKKILNKYNINN